MWRIRCGTPPALQLERRVHVCQLVVLIEASLPVREQRLGIPAHNTNNMMQACEGKNCTYDYGREECKMWQIACEHTAR
jgi:hypothetical protein